MPTKLKTKGFRKKLTRQEKLRRKLMREVAQRNGQAFVQEAISRTPIAPRRTRHVWRRGTNRTQVTTLLFPRNTPQWAYVVSGWKKAAQRTRITFNAPHMGGVGEGRASIRMMKGTTLLRTILENGTKFAKTLDEGGTLPPLPPINEDHTVQASNMLRGGLQASRRAAKGSLQKVRAQIRATWRRAA